MPADRVVYPALLVAFLVVAVPAAAAPVGTTAAAPSSPNMLELGQDRTSDFVRPSTDVGATLAIGHREGTERLRREALTRRLDQVESAEERQRLLFLAATETKQRADTLRGEERAIRRAYLNRSIPANVFIKTLGVHAAEAAQLRLTMQQIGDLANEVEGITVRRRILQTRLIGFNGPVRTRILHTIEGSNGGGRIHVIATANGTALSTFDKRGRYLRETYRSDRWTRDSVGETDLPGIVTVIQDVYPDSYNRSASTSFTGGLGRGIYRASLQLPSGTLTAHLDADTEEVFYEVRKSPPASLASDAVVIEETETLRLVVNRSVPGGPLRIATIEPETGSPINRPVVVAGKAYRTGPDGVLWTLTPNDPRFSVRAAANDGPVTVTVRPIMPEGFPTSGPGEEGPQPT